MLWQGSNERRSSLRFLYPHNPLNEKAADEPYQEEFLALKELGASCSLFNFDSLEFEFRPKPAIQPRDLVLYRGWMLSPNQYKGLIQAIAAQGGTPVTSYENYIKCHHLPGWYSLCQEFTPETHFFPYDEKLQEHIASLGWDQYFVKDYVKSNTAEKGSIAQSAEEAVEIVRLIEKYRGGIEGGVAVRQVENFVRNSEQRYFVFNGKPYAANDEIPPFVKTIVGRMDAPFYSVDTVQRQDGTLRLVEIGDGQVSDKKRWPVQKFVKMLMVNAT